jgi:hypothetical protein
MVIASTAAHSLDTLSTEALVVIVIFVVIVGGNVGVITTVGVNGRLVRVLRSLLTPDGGFHSGSLVGYLVDVLVDVGVGVGVGKLVRLLTTFLTPADGFHSCSLVG